VWEGFRNRRAEAPIAQVRRDGVTPLRVFGCLANLGEGRGMAWGVQHRVTAQNASRQAHDARLGILVSPHLGTGPAYMI
jgi:hypothetical protein